MNLRRIQSEGRSRERRSREHLKGRKVSSSFSTKTWRWRWRWRWKGRGRRNHKALIIFGKSFISWSLLRILFEGTSSTSLVVLLEALFKWKNLLQVQQVYVREFSDKLANSLPADWLNMTSCLSAVEEEEAEELVEKNSVTSKMSLTPLGRVHSYRTKQWRPKRSLFTYSLLYNSLTRCNVLWT